MASLKRHDGEVETFHFGPGVGRYGENTSVREPTLSCCHCGGCVVINPLRKRERAYCRPCNRYICDGCKAASLQPDYIHRTFKDIANLVMSGNYTLSGSTCNPILIPAQR